MNMYKKIMIMTLGVGIFVGIFFAHEGAVRLPYHPFPDESKWLNYPTSEHMHAGEQCSYADLTTLSSSTMLWKLKSDEVHAQCAIEPIEQTIARLQEQLKKDREQLKQTKIEQKKS